MDQQQRPNDEVGRIPVTIEAGRPKPARKVGRPSKYRPHHHPEDVVAYFRAALDAVEEPERVESRRGGVKYVQAPVPPPTLAGYAARVGVRRETLWGVGQTARGLR